MSTQTDNTSQPTGATDTSSNQSNNNSNNNNNQNNNNNRRNNSGRGYNSNSRTATTNPKHWKGITTDIGCVLGLVSDSLDHKKSYQDYKEALMDYVL